MGTGGDGHVERKRRSHEFILAAWAGTVAHRVNHTGSLRRSANHRQMFEKTPRSARRRMRSLEDALHGRFEPFVQPLYARDLRQRTAHLRRHAFSLEQARSKMRRQRSRVDLHMLIFQKRVSFHDGGQPLSQQRGSSYNAVDSGGTLHRSLFEHGVCECAMCPAPQGHWIIRGVTELAHLRLNKGVPFVRLPKGIEESARLRIPKQGVAFRNIGGLPEMRRHETRPHLPRLRGPRLGAFTEFVVENRVLNRRVVGLALWDRHRGRQRSHSAIPVCLSSLCGQQVAKLRGRYFDLGRGHRLSKGVALVRRKLDHVPHHVRSCELSKG